MKALVKLFAVILDIILLFICGLVVYYSTILPNKYYVENDKTLTLCCFFDVSASSAENALYSSNSKDVAVSEQTTLKLFGVIPIKDVDVEEVDVPVLVPCGEPFGIKLLSDGVMVVGIGDVRSSSGSSSPAAEAGIRIGDVLVSLNGESVSTNSDISKIISGSAGAPVSVSLLRDEKTIEATLIPVYSESAGGWLAGMWVRDSTAGIGTLTFYEPATQSFGGLGHPVCDIDTGNIVPLSAGNVCRVNINGVVKGVDGSPGELIGSFSSADIGKLTLNTPCGVFGTLEDVPTYAKGLPMAMRQEVHTGSAVILSTVDGSFPKEYSVEIERVDLLDGV